MTLRYSLGRRMAGNVCAADEAFHALQREVAMLGSRGTWMWFADRLGVLETALSDAGGFDNDLAEHMESPYGYMGSQEVVDRHFLTESICVEMEDVVGAFFVALQPRLNAVKVAARRVYFAAANTDHLQIVPPKRMVTIADFESTWQVANFVKHRDEWRDVLSEQQQDCFDALVALGVAKHVNGSRELDRWTLISAACAISGETTLANAVPAIVRRCESACHDIENSIQGDFSCIAVEVAALRAQNVPKLRVRAHNPNDKP